jgi:hypothetical protein
MVQVEVHVLIASLKPGTYMTLHCWKCTLPAESQNWANPQSSSQLSSAHPQQQQQQQQEAEGASDSSMVSCH